MVSVAGITLSHPDKVLYADQGVTKLDLANYLHAVSARMLPYVSRRLVSLVRCPEGAATGLRQVVDWRVRRDGPAVGLIHLALLEAAARLGQDARRRLVPGEAWLDGS